MIFFFFPFHVRGSCAEAAKPSAPIPAGGDRQGLLPPDLDPAAARAGAAAGRGAATPGAPRERAQGEARHKRSPFLKKSWREALPAQQMSPRRMQLRRAIAGARASCLPRPLAPHQPLISPAHSLPNYPVGKGSTSLGSSCKQNAKGRVLGAAAQLPGTDLGAGIKATVSMHADKVTGSASPRACSTLSPCPAWCCARLAPLPWPKYRREAPGDARLPVSLRIETERPRRAARLLGVTQETCGTLGLSAGTARCLRPQTSPGAAEQVCAAARG